MAEITPITLVIGLPGAGKTTLLRHLLHQPEMADIAVVATQPDPPMWWGGGCPCCAPRDDVARSLRALLPRVRRDEVRRVVIETTGLADPGPILATLLCDTVAASAYRLDGIVTVVDSVNGAAALDARDLAVRQVAMADQIVLSKTDLNNPVDAGPCSLLARLRRLNPGAPIAVASQGIVDRSIILCAGLSDTAGKAPDIRAWIDTDTTATATRVQQPIDPTDPDTDIEAFCLTFNKPLPRTGVIASLERLILMHGAAVLRMKGILNTQGQNRPVAIHSVGHLLFPPITLEAWPDTDSRCSRLMFVTRNLPRAVVETELTAFIDGSTVG